MSQIVVESVQHTYRPPRGRPVLALDDVSLDVRTREFLALLGPSGCGKSTLLYLIGGFLPIEGGRILVDGKPVAGPGPDRGIVFQHFALFPWKTVRANILYGLERQGHAARRARGARTDLYRSGRPEGLRGQLSVAALRRHEAAHRDRAHARLRSGDPADGRAVRRARRADPQPDAGGAAAHLAAHAQDRDLRHPRRAGGGLSRRPRRRDVGAARAHQDDRRDRLRQDRSAVCSRARPSSTRSTRSGIWCATRRSRRRRRARHESRAHPLSAAAAARARVGGRAAARARLVAGAAAA